LEDNPARKSTSDMTVMMYNKATLRSGHSIRETVNVAQQIDTDEIVDDEE
jgi:hypothetical protein